MIGSPQASQGSGGSGCVLSASVTRMVARRAGWPGLSRVIREVSVTFCCPVSSSITGTVLYRVCACCTVWMRARMLLLFLNDSGLAGLVQRLPDLLQGGRVRGRPGHVRAAPGLPPGCDVLLVRAHLRDVAARRTRPQLRHRRRPEVRRGQQRPANRQAVLEPLLGVDMPTPDQDDILARTADRQVLGERDGADQPVE